MSFITFLLGLILGHWLAIGRDKRKEFNDAVAPIRKWLLTEQDGPSPYNKRPSQHEIDLFMHYLWPWQRSAFRKHLGSYRQACEASMTQDGAGQVFYNSNSAVIRHELACLFKFVGRR
ncbi:hypothetical protein [Lysobacter niastensis]|uniref:Uncharacterized protein n=1 Tax=Lysobacter niastensis TaxID=380629 RepID=A0ABS0B2T9_9GAMM|nr:hypothetical protein [Lysobacter niastensis]MBF6022798.1 hypothetical protein [Lysobacter niastensis]